MFKDRLSHIGPEEFLHYFMNIDSGPLKSNVDTSDQAHMALMRIEASSRKNSTTKKSSETGSSKNELDSSFLSSYNKPFGEYLEELRQACQHDIFIKRTSNIKYQPKKWSNIQAYIVIEL